MKTKTKTATKAKATPRRETKALAVRPKATLTIRDPRRMLPEVLPAPANGLVLGEEATLGALGLVEVKLTEAEEKTLSEPVLESEVMIKPTGQPYLSHPAYTRWFNRAFGRLGWAIVARSKPLKQDNSVVCPYILYIHGQPAAFAYGEQEFFAGNRDQTYGDALEATVASALRRCAKRLGVGLELWDRRWLDDFIARECVKVKIAPKAQGDKPKWQWRRRSDPPFWNELRGRQAVEADDAEETQLHASRQREAPPPRREPPQRREPPPAGNDGRGDDVISDIPRSAGQDKVGQVQRLWLIIKKTGRDQLDVRAWLKDRYGYDSTKAIKRKHYNEICSAIEAKGPLPMPAPRDPGMEG